MGIAEVPTEIDPLDIWGSTKRVCQIDGFAERTHEGWRRTGQGPPWVRLPNGRVRYNLRAADDWMRSHARATV